MSSIMVRQRATTFGAIGVGALLLIIYSQTGGPAVEQPGSIKAAEVVEETSLKDSDGKPEAKAAIHPAAAGGDGEEHVAMARAHRRKFAGVPEDFTFEFITTKGTITFGAHKAWAPVGVTRLHEMITTGFFKNGIGLFRCVPHFVIQFGIHGDPEQGKMWRDKVIKDDKVLQSNDKGYMTFATAGKDTRTTQLFWNVGNNKFLDKMGFAPIAKCLAGCELMDQIEMKYREKPNQGKLQNEGNTYLKSNFPDLDYIIDVKVTKDYVE